ncbi:hypothetical protein F2Q69_00022245 [Brassica cretica]|uniref:Uncharacterized protein n=1 Tax=Brassica cretica TaxID=69181 RepID=A0A8S9PZ23_BRACR|nr:hypothetical protein F2Q69_00022245 [Brassica cretica]
MVLLLIRCRVTRCECGRFDPTFPHCMVGAIGGKTRRDGIAAYDRVHPTGCFHGWTMGCGMRAMNPADRAGLMADSHVPLWPRAKFCMYFVNNDCIINKNPEVYPFVELNDINLVWVDTTRDRGTGCKAFGYGLGELGIQNEMAKRLNSFSILANLFRGLGETLSVHGVAVEVSARVERPLEEGLVYKGENVIPLVKSTESQLFNNHQHLGQDASKGEIRRFGQGRFHLDRADRVLVEASKLKVDEARSDFSKLEEKLEAMSRFLKERGGHLSAPENPSRDWTHVSSSEILLEGGHLLAGEETCAIYRHRRRLSPESFHASPPRRPCTGSRHFSVRSRQEARSVLVSVCVVRSKFDLTFPLCMVGAIGGKTRRDGIAADGRVHPTGCFHGWTMGCGMRAMNPAGRDLTDTHRAMGRVTVNPEGRAGLMADSHAPLWFYPFVELNDIILVRVDTTRDRGTGCKAFVHGFEELGIRNGMAKVNFDLERFGGVTLDALVMMLDTQVCQTKEAMKIKEAQVKGKAVESERHQVDAILNNDIGEVVEHDKLDEEAFLVKRSMSIGNSHWCRSTPSAENQLTSLAEH